MDVKVSVVVPVYNTEEYLSQCVDSLINQTLKEIELIFVDDGSTDRSVQILEDYQKKDARIQLYCQKNQYAGVARNNGMTHATGQYIIFLDSDDFFDKHMLEKMYKAAQKSLADITVCGYRTYNCQTKQITYESKTAKGRVLAPADLGSDVLTHFDAAPWNKLYKRQFILENDLCFQPIKNTNDTFFTRVSIVLAKMICVLPDSYINYRVNNEKSLQGSFNASALCFGEALVAIKQTLQKRSCWDEPIVKSFYRESDRIIRGYADKVNSLESERVYYSYCKDIINRIVTDQSELSHISHDSLLYDILICTDFDTYLYKNKTRKIKELSDSLKHQTAIIRDIKKSRSYKLSRVLTYVPQKLKFRLKANIHG